MHVTGNVRRARFKINGVPVKLSGRKAIVLTILAAACSIRPGATVTTERLIDVVEFLNQRGAIKWTEPNAITIWQAVCLLRKAVKAAGRDPKIVETMKGGYRLNTPNALVDESIMADVPPMNGPSRR